ncbi:ABC transporter permease [Acuticoccus kandeliae]|uniref:ABC transporter permease n=1 Tax=Acuticoccus kandeliae TaxID=2073160 RepID=UPI000D3EDC99|nr:ABC transporter permease [Acuticoccus kandeliae]
MDREQPSIGLPGRFYAALVILFLLGPIAIAMVVAFNSGERLQFPIEGVSLRWFAYALQKPQFIEGLLISIIIGLGNAVLATIAGTGAALAINHYRFRGRAFVRTAVMMPIAMPGIVLGLAMLFTLSTYDLRPGLLAATLGHAVMGLPYVVAMVTASLANYDQSLERASMNLGVGPIGTFFRVTLPMIRGGVIAGAVTAFLISFDNFSLSLFITRGDTLPLRLMQQLQSYADPSVAAMSTLLLVASFAGILLLLPVLFRSGPRTKSAADEA